MFNELKGQSWYAHALSAVSSAVLLIVLAQGELYWLKPGGLKLISPVYFFCLLGTLTILLLLPPLLRSLELRGWLYLQVTQAKWTQGVRYQLVPEWFLAAFVLVLFSDFVTRRYTFYVSHHVRSDIIYIGALIISFLYFSRKSISTAVNQIFSEKVLFATQVFLILAFLYYAAGRIIISDDHPSFLYRLELLRRYFPRIPFYNTDWNAGYATTEFYPPGVLSVYFLSYPFIRELKNFSDAIYYTYLIPYLFMFLMPWSCYFAARVLGQSRNGAVICGLLSLGPILAFFEWLLKYGTLGFVVSAGVFPLAFAYTLRLLSGNKSPRWLDVLILLIVSFLCICWTVAFLAFVPLALFALWRLLFDLRAFKYEGRLLKLSVFLLLFVLCNMAWLLSFVQQPKVMEMLHSKTLIGTDIEAFNPAHLKVDTPTSLAKSKLPFLQASLQESLSGINPIVLLLSLPGILFFQGNSYRIMWLLTILWLCVLSGVGDALKPQLEFRRLVIFGAFLMCIPIGDLSLNFIRRFGESSSVRKVSFSKCLSIVGVIVLLGSIWITPLTVGAHYANRGSHKYSLSTPQMENIITAIRNFGGEGRTFFVEFILHEWGSRKFGNQEGGHIAPFPILSGKSLYAIDFYHGRWGRTDPIPKSYRERRLEGGIEEFLDLVNASAVVTLTPLWANYVLKQGNYKFVFSDCSENLEGVQEFTSECFRLFTRREVTGGYFEKGDGDIEVFHNKLKIKPRSKEIVLKFRMDKKLKVYPEGAGELSPVFAFNEDTSPTEQRPIYFISLSVSDEALAKGEVLTIELGR